MWQGIEVVGDPGERQALLKQGFLNVMNGSVIEHALTAVRNCLATDATTTGGVINAFSSTFRNNSRAVELRPYAYTSTLGQEVDYVSLFRQCAFTVNDQNLFAANDTVFTEHVRLCGVKGVPFKGCSFSDSTTSPTSGRRGVFTDDAGFTLDTYCDMAYTDCECPESHATYTTFSGFTTAVEVNTTGNPYPVSIDEARFGNNGTGVRINGNNFATVTRCVFNMQAVPAAVTNGYGLYLNNCTGYLVEENSFHRKNKPSSADPVVTCGIVVNNSGNQYNLLHRNSFTKLHSGICASGNNGALQMTCNTFSNNLYGICSSNWSVAPVQGSASAGADNDFINNQLSDFYHTGLSSVTYYYSVGGHHAPTLYSGLTPQNTKKANTCAPTLCDNGGGIIKSLSDFQSDMDADTYYESVRALMSDSLLDLAALEQWHVAAQPIADPYSLTETRFMEGYNEPFTADADDAEMANYAEFHAMKLSLRNNDGSVGANDDSPLQDGHINWYALTPAQIAQLQTIAERNIGRASVMAKGVLCFFFDICYDDDLAVGVFDTLQQDGDTSGVHTKRAAMDGEGVFDTPLRVWPNPTDDLLFVELRGGDIATIALYDLQGRVVTGTHAGAPQQGGNATLNVKSVPAGVYVLRVTGADGKEFWRKIVRR